MSAGPDPAVGVDPEVKRADAPGVIDPIRDRWSPRAFADRPVGDDELRRLFEAARWAASSRNEQPWRFIVVRRSDPDAFERALACLRPGNQGWAKGAPLLIFTAVKTTFDNTGGSNRTAQHDLGLAVGNLSVQATAMGLALHQMGGIELDAVRTTFGIPDGFQPVTAIALGRPGDPSALPEDLQRRERAPRKREPLAAIVFENAFGEPSGL